MKRILFLLFFCFSLFFSKTEAAELRDVIYYDVASHIGQTQEAVWITDCILYASSYYQVDPILVTAMMEQESNFNLSAVSHAGALGAMQLMPETASIIGVDPTYPVENIIGGVCHIRTLLNSFANCGEYGVTYAVAAYNAGSQAVIDHGGVPPYEETIGYVYGVADKYANLSQYIDQ